VQTASLTLHRVTTQLVSHKTLYSARHKDHSGQWLSNHAYTYMQLGLSLSLLDGSSDVRLEGVSSTGSCKDLLARHLTTAAVAAV
jgi:hypothetical protein